MIRSESITMIREKALEGKSAYMISKELGFSKNTVKKYMDTSQNIKPTYPTRASKLDPFKEYIHELMAAGIFNCVVIMERITEKGYDGGISILKDYVKPFRPAKKSPAVQRYETPPGKQAQMDWGISHYVDDMGHEHKVPAFIMILGNSRMKYVEFTKRCDLFSLQRCILDAFEYFEGVPETILTDNMKTVILGRESGKPVWHPGFLDFANDIGFVPKVCKVRKPQTKGKVERLVHYVKDNFMPGRVFSDIHDLNRQAISWCDKVNAKISSSTGYTPIELLPDEHLKGLPDTKVCDRYRFETRLVSRDGFVSYDGVRYGVPWQYSGKYVTVRAIKDKLEIFDGLMLIASHDIEPHSGRILFLDGQYRGLAEKNGLTFFTGARMHTETVEIRPLSIYEELLEVSNG